MLFSEFEGRGTSFGVIQVLLKGVYCERARRKERVRGVVIGVG